MKEYIDRAKYRERLSNLESWCQDLRKPGLTQALQMFNEIPAADVAPVVHGRWILEREPNGKPYCFHCSVCDSDYHCIGIVVASDYCPKCGAKMDGGVDDACL